MAPGENPSGEVNRAGIEAPGSAEKDCHMATPQEEQRGNLANQMTVGSPQGGAESWRRS